MPLIRAVLFDYALVLSGPPDPSAWRRMRTILGSDDPLFHDTYWRHRRSYDLGRLSGLQYWRTVGQDLHREPTANDLAALIDADIALWTRPNQPMIDWAAALQHEGMPTGILSNIGDAMEDGIMERVPWLTAFPKRIFSHRLGSAKPDEQIYQHAILALGLPPSETLFIDDRLENIEAARALGLNTIHYSSHDDFLRGLHAGDFSGLPQPGAAIRSR